MSEAVHGDHKGNHIITLFIGNISPKMHWSVLLQAFGFHVDVVDSFIANKKDRYEKLFAFNNVPKGKKRPPSKSTQEHDNKKRSGWPEDVKSVERNASDVKERDSGEPITFKRITSLWGDLEGLWENANQFVDCENVSLLITINHHEFINEVVELEVGSDLFQVRVLELCPWINESRMQKKSGLSENPSKVILDLEGSSSEEV
ncbi:hypothetical protein V6N13_004682 [Hibiscus sabdariffa]|uniref:Uncharacterized protein n=1 Tax=Hibiscus sabdariffa TaxID=183260 RepID=A0ABR2RZZ8_9ROSI